MSADPAEEIRAAIRQISDFHRLSDSAIRNMYFAARKWDADDARLATVDQLLTSSTKSQRYVMVDYLESIQQTIRREDACTNNDAARPMQHKPLAQHVADVLNEAYRRDPSAMHALVVNRVPCNNAMVDDPYVICEDNPVLPGNRFTVGMLGVLNGVLNMLGIGPVGIAFEVNEETGEAINDREHRFLGFTAPVSEPASMSLQHMVPVEWLNLGASQKTYPDGSRCWVIPTQLGEITARIQKNERGEPDVDCGVESCSLRELQLETLGQIKMLLAVARP